MGWRFLRGGSSQRAALWGVICLGFAVSCRSEPARLDVRTGPPRATAAPAASAVRGLAESTATESKCVPLSAPLAVPLVRGASGGLYAITLDSYLHVYGPDLEHRFSFSLEGMPVAALALRDGILVASASRVFSSVSERGVERYHFRTLGRPLFGLTRDLERRVLFVGADGFVYAMSETGRAHYRVELPAEATGAPVVDGKGTVWVPLRSGVARLDGARTPRVSPTSEPVKKLGRGEGGLWVVSGERLASLDPEGGFVEVGRGPEARVDSGRAFLRGQPDQVEIFEKGPSRRVGLDVGAGGFWASRSWLWWEVRGSLRAEHLPTGARRSWGNVGDAVDVVEFEDGLVVARTRTQLLCRLAPPPGP